MVVIGKFYAGIAFYQHAVYNVNTHIYTLPKHDFTYETGKYDPTPEEQGISTVPSDHGTSLPKDALGQFCEKTIQTIFAKWLGHLNVTLATQKSCSQKSRLHITCLK